MRRLLWPIVLVLACSACASDGERLPTATAIVQQAKSECVGVRGGRFSTTEQTITLHDFTGDGRPEEVVDASQFACSSRASLWAGSGGSLLWVVVGERVFTFRAHRWRVVDMGGQQVLLLAVHFSECGDAVGPCYRALVWHDGFQTTR